MLQLRAIPRSLFRTGRIGIEFDAGGVACAQVERLRNGFRLVQHRLSARIDQHDAGIKPSNSGDSREITPAELLLTTAGCWRSEVAAVLPMEVCDLRVLELPESSADELRQMVLHEVASSGTERNVVDYWPTTTGMSLNPDMVTVCAFAVDRDAVDSAVALVKRAGFQIEGIDGIPTAAARAVAMVPGLPTSPNGCLSLALHIGWEHCTCVFVRNGIPWLVRVPGVPGLSILLKDCCQALNLSLPDLMKILRGMQRQLLIRVPETLIDALISKVHHWTEPLAREILRSITFSRRPGMRAVPSTVVLMGPGCVIPGLPELLSAALNIETGVWSLQGLNHPQPTGEFAIAAALSTWELSA